ncbi:MULTISPECIES: molybdopterin-binding protein [Bradyrhizobium]|uniref:Molybdopterin molybdenumtransferase n=2 Tax=Bradyrhizobium TaxID=374 RepID=A0ABY0Q1K0_9BRAD|nr:MULTISPECIES: molybdopterin-binding protein [Bradyrhizobium]SDJ30705.1 Molybdopterin biosynthesis enzyme [Bradyrhizobium ottawaense]SEC70717.1 Molybdopterin biosynthesis enzyme [Bradyrhizobium lablabi]SHK84552.1 Molybdopterin biosynthesis enzyme [Bradyrhizobium lablabi]
MTPNQRLPASLTPLDAALTALLDGLGPVPPIELSPHEALRCIAAEMPPIAAHPPHDIAATDGFALRARDLVGASSYSPVPLAAVPVWVEAGEAIPGGCDCVLDSDSVDVSGPIPQVVAEAIPGQGVRRAGEDIAAGSHVVEAGRRVVVRDLLVARAAGIERLMVRRPRVHIVNVPGGTVTADWITESARTAGADVVTLTATARDAGSIAAMIDTSACDLLLVVGGSGVGSADATVTALAGRGEVFAHGIALQPGRTSAVGRIDTTPVVVLPGAPDQAFAAWWTLAMPALDRLSGRRPRKTLNLPLARKIASGVGIAEIVLLEREQGAWLTLAAGELSLDAIARAEAWLVVPSGSEGFAAGADVDAYMLRE